jgi:NAD(P)-dependent dehydrogenase (short-subunit alcohol dehydrogenase family)
MEPRPEAEPEPPERLKLEGRCALITGGDSGIGRAVAYAFAREGADIAIVYLEEHADAQETKEHIEEYGRRCVAITGDLREPKFCRKAVEFAIAEFGHLDVLVNNAAEQHPVDSLEEITPAQLRSTFETNVFSYFYATQAALPKLGRGASIINSSSITAYRGSPELIDYASTKGAIISFTRSLAQSLIERGIRVNAVAPGPVWTPLIPASFDEEKVAKFGQSVPMKRAAQPEEIAPSYVFLASEDSSYMTGHVLHPDGGGWTGS